MKRKEINTLLKKYKALRNVVFNSKHYWDKKDDLLEKWSDLHTYVFSLTINHQDNEKLESINDCVGDMDLKMSYSWDQRAFIDLGEEIEKLR